MSMQPARTAPGIDPSFFEVSRLLGWKQLQKLTSDSRVAVAGFATRFGEQPSLVRDEPIGEPN
jgi:hypothetical protein